MKIAIVIQARSGSTRLPGKVLLPCAGGTVLGRMLERVTAARHAQCVVVATTEAPADDEIVAIARRAGVHVVRGHATDCLARHVTAARAVDAEVVVKIPSDCPLIDPSTIDRVIGEAVALGRKADYVSNLHPATWPDGSDVEVMWADQLERAAREATLPHEREHTTPYFWQHPETFRLHNVRWETGRDYSKRYRMTLDYHEDYQLIRNVYAALWSPTRVFSLAEILDFLDHNPTICTVNGRYLGTTWYRQEATP